MKSKHLFKTRLNILFSVGAITLFLLGCSSKSEESGQSQALQAENDSLKKKISSLEENLRTKDDELEELKNTPEQRWIKIERLISEDKKGDAIMQMNAIRNKFPGTDHAKRAETESKKLQAEIDREKEEAARKKALGFKAIKASNNIKVNSLNYAFQSVQFTNTWTFDSYGSQYFYRDAERGEKYLVAKVSISSEEKNPKLPPIQAYKLNGGDLQYIGTLDYKFRRWSDYGAYLGNTADYGNDFAHSKTIPFSLGLSVKEDISKSPVFLVIHKDGCFVRSRNEYGNPEVYYKNSACNIKRTLKVEDFDENYRLVKVFNSHKM